MYQLVKKNISNTTIKGKVKQKNTHGSNQDVTTDIKVSRPDDKKKVRKGKMKRQLKRAIKKAQKV